VAQSHASLLYLSNGVRLARETLVRGEMEPSKLSHELLWKQYALHVDLYKFYLDLTIKANVFYYAVTGAILSYYFQGASDGVARYALWLPIVMSFGLGGIFLYGTKLLAVVRKDVFYIRDKLGLETAPEFMLLTVFLWVTGLIMFLVGVALLWYVLCRT
jgi:hypothetical protein